MTKKQKRTLVRIVLSAVLFAAAFFLPVSGRVRGIAFAVPYLTAGVPILKKAGSGLFRGQVFDENVLMSAASLGAFLLGEYPEGVAVMLFSACGSLFESYAVEKSRACVKELADLCPDTARVLRDGAWIETDPESVAVDDVIRVLPGERVPLDGTVEEGHSSLDTKALTGEAMPRDVAPGDGVAGGCVNLTGMLTVRVAKTAENSAASRILALVEDAAARKAPAENFVSKFARYYTPVVFALAFLTAVIPSLITGGWETWVYRALSFLVVSCPCAVVISVPLAYFGGIGGASRSGILIKGSGCLETLAQVRTAVFDKTGTLTEGVFEVSGVCASDPEKVLEIAAYCESGTTHPIAASFLRAYGKPLDPDRISGAETAAGYGVSVFLDGKRYFAGNEKYLKRHSLAPIPVSGAGTRVYVFDETECLGVILISDRIRETSAAAISDLRSSGIAHTCLLTGDGEDAARAAGNALGLDEIYSGLLPAEKAEQMRRIAERSSGKILYAGDGINDAPVLALSDVGVAMGALGSDAAMEAADVVLMNDDPRSIPKAIRIARRTRRIVTENLIFAIGVKIAILLLCVFGAATMWSAVFADVGVSVIAVLNSLRNLRKE